ncbi:MAG: SPOR domain-containing protein [Spirochaetota bacterium]
MRIKDMEHQKVLWIIFSVTLFVLVVVGIGLIWFLPADRKVAEAAPAAGTAAESLKKGRGLDFDPIEWVRKSEEYPGLEEKKAEGKESKDLVVVYGEDEGKDRTGISKAAETPKIEEAKPSAAGKPVVSGPSVKKEIPVTLAPTRKTVEQPAKKEQAAPPKMVRVTEYWIQTGSYKSKARAEQVKENLSAKGVESRITSRLLDGEDYFRVRIGPYTNKDEAQKFLEWVKSISGFENSYVSMVYALRDPRPAVTD